MPCRHTNVDSQIVVGDLLLYFLPSIQLFCIQWALAIQKNILQEIGPRHPVFFKAPQVTTKGSKVENLCLYTSGPDRE